MHEQHWPEDIERAAGIVEAHRHYRVLRALPPIDLFPLAEPQGRVRTAAVIDVETVGLSTTDPIIDLAIQRIAFDEAGRIVRIGRPRQWFEDPGVPIPPEITRLTGITDADVAGQRIDDAQACALIAASDCAVAHNAMFDSVSLERRLSAIAGHAWACSCNEVPWSKLKLDGRKLGHLLMQRGLFHQGHRASADVCATINLLAQVMPDGETALAKLIASAERPTLRMEATRAPFEAKDTLKARGYRWDPAKRVCWRELPMQEEAAELDWLASKCGCVLPMVATVTWNERHCGL